MKFFYSVIVFSLWIPLSFATEEGNKRKVTLNQAIQRLTLGTQNKLLTAETKQIKQQTIHFIKLITEKGRVKLVNINANTGGIVDYPPSQPE